VGWVGVELVDELVEGSGEAGWVGVLEGAVYLSL